MLPNPNLNHGDYAMHMTPQIVTGDYYVVNRTDYFTNMADAIDHATEILKDTEVYVSVEKETGTIGRLTADGYLDCTEWIPYDSEAEAMEKLWSETRGYYVFKLPACFASAAINDDWSSSDLSDEDKQDFRQFIKDEKVIEFIDIIDNEPFFTWSNDLNLLGSDVVRYLARIDDSECYTEL